MRPKQFNQPRYCDDRLSTLGKKVYSTLISKRKEMDNLVPESRVQHVRHRNYHEKKVLMLVPTLKDSELLLYAHTCPTPASACSTSTPEYQLPTSLAPAPSTTENPKTPYQTSNSRNFKIITQGQARKDSDVDWNDMFDDEILSPPGPPQSTSQSSSTSPKCKITKRTKLVVDTVEINENQITLRKQNESKRKKQNKHDVQTSEDPIYNPVKATKKQKKPTGGDDDSKAKNVGGKESTKGVEKQQFRKQKYTMTVKNWLNDIRPAGSGVDTTTAWVAPAGSGGGKIKKKVVQAILVNRDGVMKYATRAEGRALLAAEGLPRRSLC